MVLSLATMPVFAAETFPVHPLAGTFELHSSTPSLEGVDPRDLQPEIFQTGQRLRIEYAGEYGSEWPDREVYKITLLPPFAAGFCLRTNWKYSCPSYDSKRLSTKADVSPTHAIIHEAYLDVDRLKSDKDVRLYDQFLPYGLKRGDFVYALTYTDSRAAYSFYFKDWNTIISDASYSMGDHIVSVVQVLKRVKAPGNETKQ